jgi:hypothetical protein
MAKSVFALAPALGESTRLGQRFRGPPGGIFSSTNLGAENFMRGNSLLKQKENVSFLRRLRRSRRLRCLCRVLGYSCMLTTNAPRLFISTMALILPPCKPPAQAQLSLRAPDICSSSRPAPRLHDAPVEPPPDSSTDNRGYSNSCGLPDNSPRDFVAPTQASPSSYLWRRVPTSSATNPGCCDNKSALTLLHLNLQD